MEAVKVASSGLAKIFGNKVFMFFMVFILLNVIIIGIENKSIEPALQELGERLFSPTVVIDDFLKNIIDNKGILFDSSDVFKSSFGLILFVITLISQFYLMIAWICLLSFVIKHVLISDSSKAFASILISIILFILIQIIYILIFRKEVSPWVPITVFIDMFKAAPYIVKPIVKSDAFQQIWNIIS
jgi:magnesium-transporting ATPase (P-type)